MRVAGRWTVATRWKENRPLGVPAVNVRYTKTPWAVSTRSSWSRGMVALGVSGALGPVHGD